MRSAQLDDDAFPPFRPAACLRDPNALRHADQERIAAAIARPLLEPRSQAGTSRARKDLFPDDWRWSR
jgi:hypothetical protein